MSGLFYTLYITPTVSGLNARGTLVTVKLKWVGFYFGVFNNSNATANIPVTGANPRTATVVTDVNGIATFSYTGTNAGQDTIIARSVNGDVVSNAVPVTWVAAQMRLTGTPVTGRFFTADGSGTFNTPATQQPVFTQVFPSINFNPVAQTLRPFTNVVTDAAGTAVGQIAAQGNDLQAGVNALYNFSAAFTGSLNVPAAGQVSFAITSGDGFVFGIGNSATRVSGPQLNVGTATTFSPYAVMGGANQRSAPATHTIVVNFPAPGVYPYELDYAKGGENKLTLTMLANGAPIPASALLTVSPAAVQSQVAGSVQSFVVALNDASGVVLPNLPVTLSVRGPNQQAQTLVTDGTGQVGFSYAGSPQLTGTDVVQASAAVGGATAYSHVVAWNSGTNQAPQVSAGAGQAVTLAVTLPATAVLNGRWLPLERAESFNGSSFRASPCDCLTVGSDFKARYPSADIMSDDKKLRCTLRRFRHARYSDQFRPESCSLLDFG